MNKQVCFIIVLLFLAVPVLANEVIVLKLHYDRGDIDLVNSSVKYGYYPDRRYQPDSGYRIEIISDTSRRLYESKFKAPNEIFIDGTDEEGELSGGRILLDDVDFALTLPYYEEMKEVRIYSPEDKLVSDFDFDEEKANPYVMGAIISILSVLIIILIILILKQRKNKGNS